MRRIHIRLQSKPPVIHLGCFSLMQMLCRIGILSCRSREIYIEERSCTKGCRSVRSKMFDSSETHNKAKKSHYTVVKKITYFLLTSRSVTPAKDIGSPIWRHDDDLYLKFLMASAKCWNSLKCWFADLFTYIMKATNVLKLVSWYPVKVDFYGIVLPAHIFVYQATINYPHVLTTNAQSHPGQWLSCTLYTKL